MSQPSLASVLQPAWTVPLSSQYFVNSVAITNDGSRVVAGTFYHNYTQGPSAGPSAPDLRVQEPPAAAPGISPYGTFGIYCYDNQGSLRWSDPDEMFEGVYWVAISGDGQIAAAAGWYSDGKNPTPTAQGLLRFYDATGTQCHCLLDYTAIPTRVNAVALSGDGSVAVAIAGNTIYIFSQQNGVFSPPGTITLPSTTPQAIAVHPDGTWLAAVDNDGTVYMILNARDPGYKTYTWQAQNGPTMHSVAISGQSTYFVVGADDGTVYLFEQGAMIQSQQPVAQYQLSPNVVIRWVALSGNAGLVTAVFNLNEVGMLTALTFDGQNLNFLWHFQLNEMPNSTSTDAQGLYVTAADGYNGPGDLYLFTGGSGTQVASPLPVSAMCWPMFLSADGSAIAAGSDNGTLYYFQTSSSTDRKRE